MRSSVPEGSDSQLQFREFRVDRVQSPRRWRSEQTPHVVDLAEVFQAVGDDADESRPDRDRRVEGRVDHPVQIGVLD
jgi:hypothetical protein